MSDRCREALLALHTYAERLILSDDEDRRAIGTTIIQSTRVILEPVGLVDDEHAAVLLSVPKSWVGQEARAGRIPHVMLGHYRRYDPAELMAWANGRTVGPRRA